MEKEIIVPRIAFLALLLRNYVFPSPTNFLPRVLSVNTRLDTVVVCGLVEKIIRSILFFLVFFENGENLLQNGILSFAFRYKALKS